MKADFTIYFNPITANSIKMQLLCNALDIKPDFKKIELHQGEQKSLQFLQLNPDGKIPVLVDGEHVLSESNAILQYLAQKYQSPLWPADLKAQSQALKWLFWQSNGWNEAIGAFAHRRVVLPHWGYGGREKLSPQRLDHFHRVMTKFDIALAGKQYLAGDHFLVGDSITIADISIASFLIFAAEAQIPVGDYVNVSRWLEQLADTPWWQTTKQSLLEILSAKP